MARDNLARKNDDEFEAANGAYYGNSPVAQEALKERQATKTVQGDFESKGIAARAYQKTSTQDANDLNRETANNIVATAARSKQQELQQQMVAAMQSQVRRAAAQKVIDKVATKAALAGGTRSVFWWLLGVMATVYVWQFVCAILSLVGFGGQAILTSILDDTWYGKAISFVAGFFVDLKNLIPFDYLGFAFWGIALILTIGTVIGLLLWFTLRGKSIIHNTTSTLISFVCISLNILPVTNIFPWLLLWALYIEAFVPAKNPLFSTT